MRIALALCIALLSAACSSSVRTTPSADFVWLGPVAATPAATESSYRIGAADLLNVTVFRVPELTVGGVRVDPSGGIQLPLLGSVQAAGLTANELAQQIETALGERYLRDPQVNVSVAEAASQKITVDGAVNKPGVYTMQGPTTLLQAVAMAEGPTRVAALDNVAVFRTIDGRRAVALFNVAEIRTGALSDPHLQGEDIVIVDTSRFAATLRDVVQALPGLGIFAYF